MQASISVDWVGQGEDFLKLGDRPYNWVYKGVLDIKREPDYPTLSATD